MEESMVISILNLKSSDVDSISTAKTNSKSTFVLKLKPTNCSCPFCNSKERKIKEYKSSTVRHAVALDERFEVLIKKRRYICLDCGKTYTEPSPLANERSTISKRTELSIMKELKDPSVTYAYLAKKYNISPTQVIRIFDKYINYARNTIPVNLCIDEVYVAPSSDYKYACILYDYDTRKVVDIIRGRRKSDLDSYFSMIPQCELKAVAHSIADMWDTYRAMSNRYFPNAIHSIDSFHVVKAINEKLNKRRCTVMNRFKNIANSSSSSKSEKLEANKYYYLYKNFYRLLLKNYNDLEQREPRYNKVFGRYLNTDDLIDLMLNEDEALGTLYQLKEKYIRFNSDPKVIQSNAAEKLDDIINDYTVAATKCDGLACCIELANMLANWRQEIINSFPVTIGSKRYHNGIAESCNAIIKKMVIASNGITNFKRFRNRVLYIMDTSDSFVHIDQARTKAPNIAVIQPKKKSE